MIFHSPVNERGSTINTPNLLKMNTILQMILGAIIFMLVFTLWTNADIMGDFFDTDESISTKSGTKIIPSEMPEFGWTQSHYESCSFLESLGESKGIADLKSNSCREACGKRSMESNGYDCEADLFVCYCQPQ